MSLAKLWLSAGELPRSGSIKQLWQWLADPEQTDVAERAARQLETADQELPAAAWLPAEYPAVHQGLAWALDHDPATALRLALGLGPWWLGQLGDRFVVMNRHLSLVVDGLRGGPPSAELIDAIAFRALTIRNMGRLAEAAAEAQAALDLARQIGHAAGEAKALWS